MPEQEQSQPKTITFDNKKYSFDALSDEVKNEVRGLQVCESQLRLHQDTLKLLTISRQTIAAKIQEAIKDIEPIE